MIAAPRIPGYCRRQTNRRAGRRQRRVFAVKLEIAGIVKVGGIQQGIVEQELIRELGCALCGKVDQP
jgi:hypothetical protein